MATKDEIRRAQEAFRVKMEKQGNIPYGSGYIPKSEIPTGIRDIREMTRKALNGGEFTHTEVSSHWRTTPSGFRTRVRQHERQI